MTREEAIKMVQAHKFPKPTEEWQMLNNEAIDMAIEALSAEYEDYEHATLVDIKEPLKVEVVRCKDCKHYNIPIGEDGWTVCPMNIAEQPNAFCSRGERREP